jgi:hypothetical protein
VWIASVLARVLARAADHLNADIRGLIGQIGRRHLGRLAGCIEVDAVALQESDQSGGSNREIDVLWYVG